MKDTRKLARAARARALISNGNRAKLPCPPGGRTGSNDRLSPGFGHRSEDAQTLRRSASLRKAIY